MAENKTQATAQDVTAFLESVEHPTRRADGLALDQLFRQVTGFRPVMWGPAIVGYGRYHYRYASGRQGDFLATGFAPRKGNMSVYIMPGYGNFQPILDRLGKHKTGKSCLYINKMADIDTEVLAELVTAGLKDLNTHWPVQPT